MKNPVLLCVDDDPSVLTAVQQDLRTDSLHVDMAQRRSSPMPRSVIERLDQVAAAHRALSRPPQAGRVISLGR